MIWSILIYLDEVDAPFGAAENLPVAADETSLIFQDVSGQKIGSVQLLLYAEPNIKATLICPL